MDEVSAFGVIHKGIRTKVWTGLAKETPRIFAQGARSKMLKLAGKPPKRYHPPKRIGDTLIEAKWA
jgi:hypothetical protein